MSTFRPPRENCRFGVKCNRRNVKHFQETNHPHLEDLLDKIEEEKLMTLPEKLDFRCDNRALLKDQMAAASAVREARLKEESGRMCWEVLKGIGSDGKKGCRMTRDKFLKTLTDCGEEQKFVAPPGEFAAKHREAAPYYIFFTVGDECRENWRRKNSVTFCELLDKSLGTIIDSLHLNCLVDMGWLCAQYLLVDQIPEMTVFCDCRLDVSPLPATFEIHTIKCPQKEGSHHSMLSILQYVDKGIRVIVSTANLHKDDWSLRTQGVWMSQHLPCLPMPATAFAGESPTGFKKDLLRYLACYKKTEMRRWRGVVMRTDFSSVNVALVCSVPGFHRVDSKAEGWGLTSLEFLLKKHVEIPKNEPETTIVAQTPSIGSLGDYFNEYLGSTLAKSMAHTTRKKTMKYTFKVMYPTIEDYKSSFDMSALANCLCYSEAQHVEQPWMHHHLCKWSSSRACRSEALPHIKTYTRISKDEKRLWWFVLGSPNLTKNSWGYRRGEKIHLLNYEASVVFLPKFVIDRTSFPLRPTDDDATPLFPLPYDLPLIPYGAEDKPFVPDFFEIGDEVFTGRNCIVKFKIIKVEEEEMRKKIEEMEKRKEEEMREKWERKQMRMLLMGDDYYDEEEDEEKKKEDHEVVVILTEKQQLELYEDELFGFVEEESEEDVAGSWGNF